MNVNEIIIISGLGLIILIGITYAIWYQKKKKNDPNFENVQVDFFVIKIAKKFRADTSIKFILQDQLNYQNVRELNENYRAMMMTERMVYLFKFFAKNPEEQSDESIAKEKKLIEKLASRTNFEVNNFCIVKFFNEKIYFSELKKWGKKSSDILLLINEIMWLNKPEKINQSKLDIFKKREK